MSTREANAPFSTLVLRLIPDEKTRNRLDVAFLASGNLEKALTRWALGNLDAMRYTKRWRAACAMSTGLSSHGEIVDPLARKARNATFNALRSEFYLTSYDFSAKVLELRRDSVWIAEHVPSSSALVHATVVWENFAAHLFRSAGRPRVPRLGDSHVLQGYARDTGREGATSDEIESALANGRNPPLPRNPRWSGLALKASPTAHYLAVSLHPSKIRFRNLMVPVKVSQILSEREAWYLNDPDSWRQIKIVRREVRSHYIYEVHLLCTKPAYRDPARYKNAPAATVGVDLGVSTLAAVGIDDVGTITEALLIRATSREMEQRRQVAKRRRRTQRALERSRRSTNPEAYGSDRHGRAGKGARRPGRRLTTSKAYYKKSRALRDERRRERETRTITTNRTAIAVVQRAGKNIITEDVQVKVWQRTWGRSIGYFAPGALMAALEREALLAGGSFTKVPCSLGLTQTCHCGAVKHKSLSERWHRCTVCGGGYDTPPVDRDVHSAYLAAFVKPSQFAVTLDTDRALAAWSGAEAPLVAVSRDPLMRRTSQSRSRDKSWSRRNASNRAGRVTASDADPDILGRDRDSLLVDVGVGKAHAERFRYEVSISGVNRPPGHQLQLDR